MSVSSFTTLLICLPMGAAVAIWVLPLSRYATGALAVLVSLLEVGIWIEQAARFDFGAHGLQFSQRASWISDLHVSYHVGEYGFSLWLVGLTVVCMAAAIGYGFWVGRDRARAYFGLMIFLTGATVGVFVAQDLLLLLRVLRGDADPALRPRRRVGRPGPAPAQRSSSSSTRWPARSSCWPR